METINFEKNVEEIRRKVAAEDLDAACVQLHGLIYLFPKEIFLREMLAEVYAKFGDAANAGRFWYLIEDKTPETEAACREFEKKFDDDLLNIFWKIIEDFRNEKENIIGTTAEKPLRELQEKAYEQKGAWKGLPMDFFAEPKILSEKEEREGDWFVRGCLLAIVIVLILAVVGFFTIVNLLKVSLGK